jgi:hypothetical protein
MLYGGETSKINTDKVDPIATIAFWRRQRRQELLLVLFDTKRQPAGHLARFHRVTRFAELRRIVHMGE